MSAQSKRKVSEERFSYSWYLPVPGGEGSVTAAATVSQQVPPEVQPVVPQPASATSKGQSRKYGATHLRGLGSQVSISSSMLKIAGIAGWSIAAGVGLIALLATQSPVPMGNVLALCGVWAAISALIWFVPGKLMK
jgi:hypothetical protein